MRKGFTRVIRDCREASLDLQVPHAIAKALFDAGHLSQDLTNSCYTTRVRGTFPYAQARAVADAQRVPLVVLSI